MNVVLFQNNIDRTSTEALILLTNLLGRDRIGK